MAESDLNIRDLEVEVAQEVPRTYRDLLRAANFSRDEIQELHRIHNGRALVDLFGGLATTAAVPLLYLAIPNPLTVVVCVLLSIPNFNSFAQVVHGSGHGKFLSNGRWNDIAGSIGAALLGFTRVGHALAHQLHHVNLNTEADSDRIWGRPDQPTGEIFRMWLRDIFLISAAKRLLQYMRSGRKSHSTSPWQQLVPRFVINRIGQNLPVVGVQAIVIAYYTAVIGPEFYLYFYVLPILTIYPAQIRIRTACEHSFETSYKPRTLEERWVSRSIQANLFERLVIAPLLIQYHFEHHLLPGVPYYNLPSARHILERKGLKVPLAPGYFAFLFRRWREERQLARSATAA